MLGRNPPTQFFRRKFTCFHQIWRNKNWKTVIEYGDNSSSRNRCWDYNIPNRSSFRALQIWRGEIRSINFLRQNSLVFIRFGGKKIEKLWLNTAITLDPEIVDGPIIYQIEAVLELYKYGGMKSARPIFRPKFTCFHHIWRKKNRKTVIEYGHNSWSRNRCWDYNIPNWSSFRALQIWRGKIRQPNFSEENSLVFIRFGGKKIEKLW